MADNINRVCVAGNLTQDPETYESGACRIRIAVNGRRKRDGQYQDHVGYYNVISFGGLASIVQQYLAKGRQVMVDGKLDWYESEKDGQKRERVSIMADSVQFLGGGEERPAEQEEIPF